MPISPARETAYRILCRVESGREFAVDLLQSPKISSLKEVDRRLATELVMGTLRRRGELDFWLEKLGGKPTDYFDPEILMILRMGLYQILFLEKIPKSAVVNEAVELAKAARKRSAAGLVNAVLRKAAPAGHAGGEEAVRSLPAWLAERWARSFGARGMKSLACASVRVPATTLRIAEGERDEIQRRLAEEGVKTRPAQYSSLALIVESGSAANSSAVREASAAIQDEASQLVATLVAPRPGDRILDLCAAPGIKTGQIAQALGKGLIVACDLSARRLRTMARLLPKALPDALRTFRVRLDAARELCFGIQFDRILLDAPCSGTGTLARNPEIKWRLQPSDLKRRSEIQTQMLRQGLAALAPGGRLVYATCSLEPEENEEVVERVLQASPQFRALSQPEISAEFPALSLLFDAQGFFHTRPDVHGMDGFFAAVIHRTG